MLLYIKGDFTKRITFGYEELAHKMWFKEKNQKELEIGHSGNDEMLQEDCYIWLTYPKWLNDEKWNTREIIEEYTSFRSETIGMEFENAYISDYREKGDYLRLTSNHKDILTVDKRAFYIMAIEVATTLDGQISEDDKKSWMSVDEFKEMHQDVLSLTFDKANEISLKEIFEIEVMDDPIWEELDKQREEYIKIHGERVYDDDDDDEDDEEEVFGF